MASVCCRHEFPYFVRGMCGPSFGAFLRGRGSRRDAGRPYVLRGASGWESQSVRVDGAAWRTGQLRSLAPDGTVQIPAVGTVPAFAVKLRGPAAIAADAITAAAKAPLFVVADTHGEYEILVTMLRAHKIVGPQSGMEIRARTPGGAG